MVDNGELQHGAEIPNPVITRASPPKKVLKRNKSFPSSSPPCPTSPDRRLSTCNPTRRYLISHSLDTMEGFKLCPKSQTKVLGGLADITKARDCNQNVGVPLRRCSSCSNSSNGSRYNLSKSSPTRKRSPSRPQLAKTRTLPSCPNYPSPLFTSESALKINADELRIEATLPHEDDMIKNGESKSVSELVNGHLSDSNGSTFHDKTNLSPNNQTKVSLPVDEPESDIDFEPWATPLATLPESSELNTSFQSTSSNCFDSSEPDTRLKKSKFLVKKSSLDEFSDETKSGRKWKKAALGVKTSLKFRDAGKMVQIKRMYDKMKNDSLNYINALAKDNILEDEDPFILQHFNDQNKSRRKQSEGESNKVTVEEQNFIVDPAGDLFFFVQAFVTIAMLYNLVSSVLRMTFVEFEETNKALIFILDSFCDVVYLIDFGIHFRTGYLDDGILVTDTGKIKAHYMKSPYFTYDMVSVIPFSLTYGVAMEAYQHSIYFITSRSDVDASLIKNILIGEAVLRLAKLAKFYAMRKFFDTVGSRTNSPGMMRALCLVIYLILSIHWIGCIYYCISEYEGFGMNQWVFPKYQEGDYNGLFYRKYIRCFYWAFLTLTTIGGPEHPETSLEYLVTCITFLLGIFIFAAVVGNVGDAITSMNESKTTYQKRADAIKLYMQHHGVPDVLQRKVKKWLEYSWMRTQGVDEQSLMDALPERLRARIAIQIHVKTLKKVKIFENCEHGLLCELVLKLRPQIFSPGDYICRIGEIGKEMFIISHGKVECIITTSSGERKTVAVLVAGQSFGEIALLGVEGCSRRTADVRAIGYSELLSLSKKALTQALEDYPEARKQLETEGRNRLGKGTSKQNPNKNKTDGEDSDSEEVLTSAEHKNISKLLEELRSFDSLKYKERLQLLEDERKTLESVLEQKDRELQDARQKIRQLEFDTITNPAFPSQFKTSISSGDNEFSTSSTS